MGVSQELTLLACWLLAAIRSSFDNFFLSSFLPSTFSFSLLLFLFSIFPLVKQAI